ncbi:uncharacterized protein LOC141637912 [Silene latifolia]|uniref:uncharacterized protein LOC141637912 n=1 Tax=Silene latifolia TaxID=37657 RepID=UPI003D781C01
MGQVSSSIWRYSGNEEEQVAVEKVIDVVVKREVTSHVCPKNSGNEEEEQEAVEKVINVVKREVTSQVLPRPYKESGVSTKMVLRREVTSHVCPKNSGNEEEQQEVVTSQVLARPYKESGVSTKTVMRREVTSHVCPKNSGNEEEQQEAVTSQVLARPYKESGVSTKTVLRSEVTNRQVLARPYKEFGVSRKTVTVLRRGPYTSIQKILLVGEGDFSFSTSLAVAFGSASNMIATSLDTQEFLTENYSKFPTNKRELELRGCMIIHGVNARKMIRHPVLGNLKFDRIIYNFPHTGCFGKSNADVRKNQKLVRGFVNNAKKMMNEDGEIHITHKSSSLFRQWDIPKIGSDQGLHLTQEIKFKRRMFPGYSPKYGFGGDDSFHCDPSKTYKFILHPK